MVRHLHAVRVSGPAPEYLMHQVLRLCDPSVSLKPTRRLPGTTYHRCRDCCVAIDLHFDDDWNCCPWSVFPIASLQGEPGPRERRSRQIAFPELISKLP